MYVYKKKHWKCAPAELKLNGPFTKILAAFCQLEDLKLEVEWSDTNFGLGLEVAAICKMPYNGESILDVRKEGCVAFVSSSREYTQDADEDSVEEFCKKILEGFIGEKKTIESFKGGDGFVLAKDRFIPADKIYIKPPKTIDELKMKLDLAGINIGQCTIQLNHSKI